MSEQELDRQDVEESTDTTVQEADLALAEGQTEAVSAEHAEERYRLAARSYDLLSGEPVYRAGRRLGIAALGLARATSCWTSAAARA